MRALISPNENNRIVQVSSTSFDVAQPLYWLDCGAEVSTDTHKFDGLNFVIKLSDAELTAQKNELLRAELAAIDAASVRALREYVASKADAPQILKDRETAAQAARAKLK